MIFREIQFSDVKLLSDYRDSFSKKNEKIHGALGLDVADDISKWIEEKIAGKSTETMINKDFVPATTFLLTDDSNLAGITNVRHELNDYLLNYSGHIGYSVRSDYRRKGYAKLMLRMALKYCFNELRLEKVLVTCNSQNLASEKVILSCGGKLENIIEGNGIFTKRFWIYKKED
ncbi:MAG: GNAT family N-acetyltransferase [Gemella sp.]|nr:GNAT family N-acetyltransferase [Gemella sp.]